MTTYTLPRAFVFRRVHSLMGLWLVLFLLEHLLTNSQAALLLGENGGGFVRMVNWIHDLPYLGVIEVFLIGTPILLHGVLGIKYLFTSKSNAHSTDGSSPQLKEYGRNKAYSWQRITSWILLIGIILHVAKFRFMEYPVSVNTGTESYFFVRVNMDNGLYTVASRLNVDLYDKERIEKEKMLLSSRGDEKALQEVAESLRTEEKTDALQGVIPEPFSLQKQMLLNSAQTYELKVKWVDALEKRKINDTEVIAVSKSFGTATLLSVRDTFKSPLYVGLYTIFVLAACFHAFNGFWTFMISWGLIFKRAAQKSMATFCVALMIAIACLGLIAIWGTYWLNLKY